MVSVALSDELTTSPILQEIEERMIMLTGPESACGGLAAGLIKAGGKRLRPLLVVICAGDKPADRQAVIDVAVAVELIHTASLIHDDIVDGAGTRRGLPTINQVEGSHAAVLTGDYLFATAFSNLSGKKSAAALPILADAIRLLCQGEMEETASLFNPDLREIDYFSRIGKKTASLLSACCAAGALIGDSPACEVSALAAFGRHLGFCFQVVDDLLDFISDEKTLGKPTGSDLAHGIITLPMLRLLHHPDHGQRVAEIIERQAYSGENMAYLRRAVAGSDCLDYTRRVALHFAGQARVALKILSCSTQRQSLQHLTDLILARIH